MTPEHDYKREAYGLAHAAISSSVSFHDAVGSITAALKASHQRGLDEGVQRGIAQAREAAVLAAKDYYPHARGAVDEAIEAIDRLNEKGTE